MRSWIVFLVFQLFIGWNAGFVFSQLPMGWAGLVAGTGFVAYGAIALWMFWTRSEVLRPLNIFVAGFFLVGLAVPMALARIQTPFDQKVTEVMGAPLALFHGPSLYVYGALFLMGLLQLGFVVAARHKKSQN